MERALKGIAILWGVVLIVIGIAHVLVGNASVFSGGPVSATVDSETRFAGTLCIGYGAAYVWAARQSVIPAALLKFLAVITLIGSVGRVISMLANGMPYWFYTFGTVAEFVIVGTTWWLAALSTAPARSGRAPSAAR